MDNEKTMVSMQSIATIRSCYPQRFGIPRQAGLVKSATASINFVASRDNELALRDMESFSHLWVIFLFHQQNYSGFKPLVQPPRLGGKKTMGVYSTRSPNRANPIGLSAVLLDRIEFGPSEIKVHVQGGDFLDGTPVLDIKPYVPFVDSILDARSDWAHPDEPALAVQWSDSALASLAQVGVSSAGTSGLKLLIEQTLTQDPRPAYERNKDGKPGQTWGAMIGPVDVKWQVLAGVAEIVSVTVV